MTTATIALQPPQTKAKANPTQAHLDARLPWYELTRTELDLLRAMLTRSTDGLWIRASIAYLSALARVSERTVQRTLNGTGNGTTKPKRGRPPKRKPPVPGLVAKGIVTVTSRADWKQGKPATFRINEEVLRAIGMPPELAPFYADPSRHRVTTPLTKRHHPGDKMPPEAEKLLEPEQAKPQLGERFQQSTGPVDAADRATATATTDGRAARDFPSQTPTPTATPSDEQRRKSKATPKDVDEMQYRKFCEARAELKRTVFVQATHTNAAGREPLHPAEWERAREDGNWTNEAAKWSGITLARALELLQMFEDRTPSSIAASTEESAAND